MTNKTIGFLCLSSSWGGLEMNVFRLALWMKNRDWHIVLYVYPNSPLYEKCLADGLYVVPLKSNSKFKDLFLIGQLVRSVKKEKINHLILHYNRNFLLAVLSKIFSGDIFKLIYQQHMQLGISKKDRFHSWLFKHTDFWITPLPSLAKGVIEKTTVNSEKIKVIPQGIELDRFTDNISAKNKAREKLKLPENSIIVGVIGRLDPKKGQHVLIEATNILHESGYKIHCLIVGNPSINEDTGYDKKLYNLMRQYNLTDFVHFKNHIDEPEYAYSCLDIFVLTTFKETYGMVTIEAMASKLPVIATNRGGTVDIIEHKKTGILIEPDNPQELADSILQLINDKERANKIASNARNVAIDKYSHNIQCQLLEDFIFEISK